MNWNGSFERLFLIWRCVPCVNREYSSYWRMFCRIRTIKNNKEKEGFSRSKEWQEENTRRRQEKGFLASLLTSPCKSSCHATCFATPCLALLKLSRAVSPAFSRPLECPLLLSKALSSFARVDHFIHNLFQFSNDISSHQLISIVQYWGCLPLEL